MQVVANMRGNSPEEVAKRILECTDYSGLQVPDHYFNLKHFLPTCMLVDFMTWASSGSINKLFAPNKFMTGGYQKMKKYL